MPASRVARMRRGFTHGFLDNPEAVVHVVIPRGESDELGRQATTIVFLQTRGTVHSAQSILLQDHSAPLNVPSVASGDVYPSVSPDIAILHEAGRLSVTTVFVQEAFCVLFRLADS